MSFLLIFLLILSRIGALVMTLPGLGSSGIPWQARAILALGASLLLTPPHWNQPLPPIESLLQLAPLVAREMLLGLALGVAVMILVSGIQLAGQVISQMSGLSLGDVVSPTLDAPIPLVSQLLESLALAIFFITGGHRRVIAALLDSFQWMPPGDGRLPEELPRALAEVATHSFDAAIRVSAPAAVALLLAIVIVAVIARTVPQLNSIAVGLNFNALIVPAALAFCLSSAAFVFQEKLDLVLALVEQAFYQAGG